MVNEFLKAYRSGGTMKRSYLIILIGTIVFGLLSTGSQLYAAPVVVTSRAALAGNDFIDWGGFGVPFTVVSNPSDISSNTSIITATVSMPSGQFERRDQSNGWDGNFASGDHLLWTEGNNGPMVISFDNPVNGAGAQIQADIYGTFTATINVYNNADTLIGSFNLTGSSTANADNSTIFLGVMDTSNTIKRIEYSVSSGDFAVNQLDLIGPSKSMSVPTVNEWGMSIFIALAGLGSIYFLKRKRGEHKFNEILLP